MVTGLRERCISLSNVAGEQLRGCIAPVVPAVHNLNPSACRSVPHLHAPHAFNSGKENDTDLAVEYLVAGSPIGDHSPVDPGILDYESESDDIGVDVASRTEVAVASPVDMETEPTSSSSVQQFSTLDPVYYQCHRDTLVSMNIDGTFGKRVISQAASFGTFEDHPGIQDTFHGTSILKGNTTVNQSVSMSFDPSKLVCISCEKEHNIVTRKPLVVLF